MGFLRKGREDGLRDLERKALQVGTDEDGGYACRKNWIATFLTC
ncbi:major capsid protein [Escherichia coli]|nr:major capsid protein [Escherichia coli]